MGGKSGGSSKTYNYHATLAGAICHGPLAAIHAVIVEGSAIWEGTLTRGTHGGADFVDLTSLIDPKWLLKGGSLRVYWGTQTQAADPTLSAHGHPAYLGTAYLVAKKFLLGREKSTAPNIEVVASRRPDGVAATVHEDATFLDDGQVNPVAALAEILTASHGAGLPAASLDTATWTAAAAWCNASTDRRASTYCSPLLTTRGALRGIVAGLLAMFEGALRWNAAGKLEIRLLERGTTPGSVPTLDAGQFTDLPRIRAGSWGDVPAGVDVRFHDRERQDKETTEPARNMVAARLFGATRTDSLDAPHVTRRDQARRIGAEYLRRHSAPPASIDVRCRREAVAAVVPGGKVLIDIDPEPGGAGLAQVAIVRERRDDGAAVRLTCDADTLIAATPYTLHLTPDAPQAVEMDPITQATVIPLEPIAWGGVGLVAILAARPQADAVGFRVFLSGAGTEFAEVGRQSGFAIRATLETAATEDAETLRLSLADGVDGIDAYLIDQTSPGGNISQARGNQMLAIVANLSNGRVVNNAAGIPEVEVFSVVGRAPVSAGVHDYSVLRARIGTQAFPWATTATAWILPGVNLEAWTHPDFLPRMQAGSPCFVRLTAFSPWAEDETPTPPERSLIFPGAYDQVPRIAWTTPALSVGETNETGGITLVFTVTDKNNDLVAVRISTRDGVGNVTQWLSLPLTGSGSEVITYPITGLPPGTHALIVAAEDAAGNLTTDDSRSLQNPFTPTEGGGAPIVSLRVPRFSPGSGETFSNGITVTLSTSEPNDRLQWSITYTAATGPDTVSETAPGTVSQAVNIVATRKLWARAGTASAWSDWVVSIYEKLPGGIPN